MTDERGSRPRPLTREEIEDLRTENRQSGEYYRKLIAERRAKQAAATGDVLHQSLLSALVNGMPAIPPEDGEIHPLATPSDRPPIPVADDPGSHLFFASEVERLVKVWRSDPPDIVAMSDGEIEHMLNELGSITAALDDELLKRTD